MPFSTRWYVIRQRAARAGVFAAYQITRADLYRRITTEILDYVVREMTSPEGGFYPSQDADSGA